MPKITITVEDLPAGGVKIQAEPNFQTMVQMEVSGHGLSPAHGYAMAMLNRAREVSKSNDPRIKILIPKIGKA